MWQSAPIKDPNDFGSLDGRKEACYTVMECPDLRAELHFIRHQDKEILVVDFTNCRSSEVEAIARRVPDYVSAKPRNSVLILTDFAGASFDNEAIRTIKETAVFDKPFVKKSALIGTASLSRPFYEDMKHFSRRDLPIFHHREEALAWLVEDK